MNECWQNSFLDSDEKQNVLLEYGNNISTAIIAVVEDLDTLKLE